MSIVVILKRPEWARPEGKQIKMKDSRVSLIASSLMLLLGCTSTVQLAVKNQLPATPLPPNLNVSVLTKTDKGQSDSTVHLGTAGQNQQVTAAFKVKNGGSYSVRGNLSNGVTVVTGGDKTINNDTSDEVDITSLNSGIVDPTDATQIQQSFGQFGENVGFNPVTVQSALASTFGGLIFYVQPSGN